MAEYIKTQIQPIDAYKTTGHDYPARHPDRHEVRLRQCLLYTTGMHGLGVFMGHLITEERVVALGIAGTLTIVLATHAVA